MSSRVLFAVLVAVLLAVVEHSSSPSPDERSAAELLLPAAWRSLLTSCLLPAESAERESRLEAIDLFDGVLIAPKSSLFRDALSSEDDSDGLAVSRSPEARDFGLREASLLCDAKLSSALSSTAYGDV